MSLPNRLGLSRLSDFGGREGDSIPYAPAPSSRILVHILLLAAVYAVGGWFGLLIAIPPGIVSAVWFPSGIALAVLFRYGYRLWPGVWLGSVIVNTWATFDWTSMSMIVRSLVVASTIGAGASLQAVAGAFLARMVMSPTEPFGKVRDVFKFAVLAGGIACLVSPTIGATSVVLGGFVDWNRYQLTWLTWWLGDTTGVIVVAPLLLTWVIPRDKPWSNSRLEEIALMLALLVPVAVLAFGGVHVRAEVRLVCQYLTIPLLVWPAVRFGRRETALAGFTLALVATLCFHRAGGENHAMVLAMQGFIGIVSMTALALATDIKLRGRLTKNLSKYKLASQSAADHWMITDRHGTILEVNQSFCDLTGYTQAEVVGKASNILKSGTHNRAFYDEMWRTIRSGEAYRGVVVNKKKSGELFHELKTITPIRNESGEIDRFLSLGKDITEIVEKERELKRTAQDLLQVNERLRAADQALMRQVDILQSVFKSMREGVVVADKDGHFIMFNEAAERMAGLGPVDAAPSDWPTTYGTYKVDNMTPFPSEELPLVRAVAGESTDGVEMIVRNPEIPEGTWLRVSGSPIRGDSGELSGGLIVMRELTDEKRAERAERELLESRAELDVARRIQQQFLPKSVPDVAGFDIAGASISATATGGDYFDYITRPDGSLFVLVGDVSGHGLGPALLMASMRGHVRALIEAGLPLGEVVRIANNLIWNDTDVDSFVTLFVARIDPDDCTMDYVNAGHTTAYVIDTQGEIRTAMESSFLPLGVLPDLVGESPPTVCLDPGDTVLISTDGISEAERPDESFYGEPRVLDVVRSNRDKPAREIVNALFADVTGWRGRPDFADDITAAIVKRERP